MALMTRFIALLRGVNVGGKRKVAMADLKAVFAEAGGQDVTTYIQSGNVVFTHRSRSPKKLAADLEERVEATTGLAVPVYLRSAREWEDVIAANPFPDVDPATLHVAFLEGEPTPGSVDSIDRAGFAPEEFELVGREVYLHRPNGMARTKLPHALEALGRPMTVRNWRTVTKLAELAAG